VVWQIRTRGSWKIDTVKLALLYLECLAFAGLLFVAFGWIAAHWPLARAADPRRLGRAARLVLYCGAGVYEELVFRGLLLGLLLRLFERLGALRRPVAAFWATLVGAALFSLFHYVGQAGDTFALGSFLQRAAAGVYFSVVFVTRGFGVAAGAHALYDILVGLIVA
jgi:membrane protease YdiL (CAAX protease family)